MLGVGYLGYPSIYLLVRNPAFIKKKMEVYKIIQKREPTRQANKTIPKEQLQKSL